MEPQIVKKPAMTLVGLQLHGKLEGMDLKALWNEFGPRMAEIKGGDPNVCYGAMDNYSEATQEFDYLAACEAQGAAEVPAGMVSWNIPAQTYAVYPCTLPQIGEAWTTVYSWWETLEEQPDGWIIVTMVNPDVLWASSIVLSFGPAVEVLEPEEVKQQVLEWAPAVIDQARPA